MKLFRPILAGAAALAFVGCSLLAPPVKPPPPEAAPVVVEPPAPKYATPVDTHRFEIDPAHEDVVGQVQVTVVGKNDTLPDIARRFNLGYEEIVRANPGVDPWLPGEGKQVVLPTQFVLPSGPRKGIVINIAAMRLFYFPPAKPGEKQVVYTHPIGIGKMGWSTPEGTTRVLAKEKDPVWRPPASVRKEHKDELGEILPAVVPAGPDNPLGKFKFTLGWAGYLIHGTNKPYGVGLRSSHGCIRLYPEDVEKLYQMVGPGTPVQTVNQPFLFGWHKGELYLQAYDVLDDDKRDWSRAQPKLLSKTLSKHIQDELAGQKQTIDWQRVAAITKDPRGLALSVAQDQGIDAVVSAAPVVENRIPDGGNWDGADDPALQAQSDIKNMVSEQQQAPRS